MFFGKRIIWLSMLCLAVLAGCSDSRPPLKASFTFTGTSGDHTSPPYTVTVDGTGSTGNIENYQWDFGDGSNLRSGLKVSHKFTGFGNFKVTLIVTDDNAEQKKVIQHIPVGYSVSGTIIAQPGSVVDSDVNDPLAPFATNDSPATAQAVPNPAVIGGFASAVATSTDSSVASAGDRFEFDADKFDIYSATLTANQTIALSISNFRPQDPQKHDLNLYLLDMSSDMSNMAPFAANSCELPVDAVDLSFSRSAVENIVVPANGNYYIVVCAFNGYSNYVLTVGNRAVLDMGEELSVQDEFVPGDVIVKFKNNTKSQLSADATTNATMQSRAASIGMVAKAGQPGNAMLFNLGDKKQKEFAFSVLGIKAGSGTSESIASGFSDSEKQLKFDTIMAVKALRRRFDVHSADLNYIRHPLAEPNDPEYFSQWHYPLIDLPDAWDLVIADALAPSTNIVVAVVDTGVVLSHPDLDGKLVPGYDFISSFASSVDGDGQDPDPDDPGEDGLDSVFHGTHVSGTIAALSNNALGVAGVTWNTNIKVMPIRALGFGGGASFDIMQGVRYAAGLDTTTQPQPAQKADIINLSLGGGRYSQFEQDIFTELRNVGVIVVAAAGNTATDVPSYPASYEGVISVSAVDKNVLTSKKLSIFSNFGQFIDIAGPGGSGGVNGVRSTSAELENTGIREANYRHLSGTSMAAPHVAGVAGLMKAVYPNMTPLEFDIMLESGLITTDVTDDGASVRNDKFGFGLVNAKKAVQLAKLIQANGAAALPPFLFVDMKSIFFLEPDTEIDLSTENLGGGSIVLDLVSSDVPWLSVTPDLIDDPVTKLGRYSVSVNRTGLANAQYQGTIKIDYSGDITGSLSVAVIMQVGPLSTVGDTGYQYGVLIDGVDSSIIGIELIGSPANGSYKYNFRGVKPGRYEIQAFSDLDNNILNCNSGESCGVFPRVTVSNSNVENIDFISRFGGDVGATLKSYPAPLMLLKKPEQLLELE